MESLNSGLGDWFFRETAFPELEENSEMYFGRYFPAHSPQMRRLRDLITQKKSGIGEFLERMISKYALDRVQMVGFTSMFMQNTASFAMAGKLKLRNPTLTTFVGGANCEFPMGRTIAERVKAIDYVFSGPALKSLPDFVEHYLSGDMSQVSSIAGIFGKEQPAAHTGRQTLGEELNIDTPIELNYGPFVKRMEEYFPDQDIKPVLPFETSRGCWWGERAHCTFCGLNGASMGYRSMKPTLAIQLFDSLFKYSGTVTRLMGVDNILPKSYLTEVLPFLNTPPDMDIFYEVKADLSEQDVAKMARARVRHIQPGIEALATITLKLMKKGTTAFQNLKFLKLCVLYGIEPVWNLLVGFPGEPEEVFRKYIEMIPLLTHLCPPSGTYPVRFDRFSPYYNQADKFALKLRPLDFYPLIYPFETDDLSNLAYYFADQNIEAPYFTATVKWMDQLRAKVGEWRARWNDPQNRPKLFLKDDVVYDSRSRSVIEHRVGSVGKALLQYLEKPTRFEDLLKAFSPALQIPEEVGLLEEKGLLFREEDRLFSLALRADPDSRALVDADHSSSVASCLAS
jgi:ribosomal peptide maturation radical SAM protein 1